MAGIPIGWRGWRRHSAQADWIAMGAIRGAIDLAASGHGELRCPRARGARGRFIHTGIVVGVEEEERVHERDVHVCVTVEGNTNVV